MINTVFAGFPPPSPPSARTNHKPARQSAHQQPLPAVHKALYLGPFLWLAEK